MHSNVKDFMSVAGSSSQSTSSREDPTTSDSKQVRSCVACYRRKVKCDKASPCSSCIRARIECVPVSDDAREVTRRTRKQDDLELLDRFQNLELVVRDLGTRILQTSGASTPVLGREGASVSARPSRGTSLSRPTSGLFPEFLGGWNSGDDSTPESSSQLWSWLFGELQELKQYLADDKFRSARSASIPPTLSEDPYLVLFPDVFGPSEGLITNMPIPQLWRVYLRSVHPFHQFLHAPSFHNAIIQTTKRLQSLDVGTITLLTAVLYLAVDSLSEDVCRTMMQEEKSILLGRCRRETERALMKSKFLNGESILGLQAFIAYMVASKRPDNDASIWSLIALANRIARSMGLHREGSPSSQTRLSTESRRRTWWELVALEVQTSRSIGSRKICTIVDSNVQLPVEINEADLTSDPGLPILENDDLGDIKICRTRYEIAASVAALHVKDKDVRGWAVLSSSLVTMDQKFSSIDALQENLQTSITSHCDLQVPLQCFSTMISQATVCEMRLIAILCSQDTLDISEVPTRLRDNLFDVCLKAMILHLRTFYLIQDRWLEQYRSCFQWPILSHLLKELRFYLVGEKVEKSWQLIRKLFDDAFPVLAREDQKTREILMPLQRLASKAWAARTRQTSRPASMALEDVSLPHRTPTLSPASPHLQWQPSTTLPETPIVPSQLEPQATPFSPQTVQQNWTPWPYDPSIPSLQEQQPQMVDQQSYTQQYQGPNVSLAQTADLGGLGIDAGRLDLDTMHRNFGGFQ